MSTALLATDATMGVEIVMATSERTPSYIEPCLSSLLSADPRIVRQNVRLIVCGPSIEYLLPWLDGTRHPRLWAERLGAADWRDVERLSAKHRTAHNLMRGLAGAGEGIYLQDDIEFAVDWLLRTAAIVDALAMRHGNEPFMLSLYAPYVLRGTPYCPYPVERFYGMQAMYINHEAARALHDELMEHHRAGNYAPDDVMVQRFLRRTGAPLYAANPSLVQHIGIVSAIEQRFHESPSFEPAPPSYDGVVDDKSHGG